MTEHEPHRHRRLEKRERGVVHPKRQLAEDVLLRILRPDGFADRPEGGDVTGGTRRLEPRLDSHQQRGHRSAAAVPHAADPRGIDIGPRLQIIDRSHPVPNAETRHAAAQQRRQRPHTVVSRAGTDLRRGLVPFPLVIGIVNQAGEPRLRRQHTAALIGIGALPVVRVSAGQDDRRIGRRKRGSIRQKEVRRHMHVRPALKENLLDLISVTRDGRHRPRVERAPGFRETAHRPDHLRA